MSSLFVPTLAFILGAGLGFVLADQRATATALVTDKGLRETGKYKLISPLLLCSSTEAKDFGQYKALESKLNALISSKIAAGEATNVSVYFRGAGGQWVAINDNDQYAPASLLKVPIMIAYYKLAENDPSILSRKYYYDGSSNDNAVETFRSSRALKAGWYTVDQLIRAIIMDSDNNATGILYGNLDTASLSEVFTDLGLEVPPGDSATAQTITAKGYTYFFRILFNATYLSPEYSEKALELLSENAFPQGLRATVPADVTVAEKFGERSVYTQTGAVVERDLHDCGIVFVPKQTYSICVMTRGKDFDQLIGVIQAIGKIVYSAVSSQAPTQ